MEIVSRNNQHFSEDSMINNNNLKNVNNKNFATLIEENYISIPEFYSDKSVFITGATGFLGKILVEKLLRSCPNLKNIYLLMRPKKEKKMHERLAEIFKVPLFDRIRDKNPEYLSKVIAIGGDMKSHELGISDGDQQILIQNVSIIFHCAATVRFNEKIREAIEINVKGTQKLMDLGRRMDDLKAFIYVSTAFSNCDRREVDEIFYEIPFNSQAVINMTDNFPDEFLDQCTSSLIGNRPNTYTFTKAIAEDVLKRDTSLPIAIVRPSIVTATVSEPMPGWIDSLFGPTAVVAANGKGIFHTMICDEDIIVDFVPADTVINVIIAAAWKTAQSKSPEKFIYNATTSMKNPITWGTFCGHMYESTIKNPFEGVLWYPTKYLTTNKFVHGIYSKFCHYLPAYILDGLSKLSGSKPMMVKIQDKLQFANESLEFFKLTEFKFHSTNIDKLLNSMSTEDENKFEIDVRKMDWNDYFVSYGLGIRQYVFKQNPSTVESCRKRIMKLKILHIVMKIVAVFFILKFVLFDLNLYEYILKMMFWFTPNV